MRVFSAQRGRYDGPDGLDVTRQFGGPAGAPFAPSWPLLREVKCRLRAAESEADRAAAWAWYRPLFLAEMRGSYRVNRPAWEALLARDVVTLLCVCPDGERCHRKLLREILVTLGARDGGERTPARSPVVEALFEMEEAVVMGEE